MNRNNTERRDSPVLYPSSGGPGAGFRPNPSPYGGGPGSGFSTPGGGTPGTRPGSQASQYSESPFGGGMSSGMSGAGPRAGQAYELESHNDDLLKGLLGKVDVLKNVSGPRATARVARENEERAGGGSRRQLRRDVHKLTPSCPLGSGTRSAQATSSCRA